MANGEGHDDRVSLREHIESLFRANDKRLDMVEAHRIELRDLLQTTVEELRRATDQYKAAANEWRGAMTDREVKFAAKTDLDPFNIKLGLLGEAMIERVEVTKFEAAVEAAQTGIGTVAEMANRRLSAIENTMEREAGAKTSGIDLRTSLLGLVSAIAVIASVTLGFIVAFK